MVRNYMETLVEEAMGRELRDHAEKYTGICQCPSCMAYARTVALNSLPPFYVTGMAGEVFGQYRHKELQYQSDVMVAIGKGIAAAAQLPAHEVCPPPAPSPT